MDRVLQAELVMLNLRLIRALRKADPGNKLPDAAMKILRDHKLLPSHFVRNDQEDSIEGL